MLYYKYTYNPCRYLMQNLPLLNIIDIPLHIYTIYPTTPTYAHAYHIHICAHQKVPLSTTPPPTFFTPIFSLLIQIVLHLLNQLLDGLLLTARAGTRLLIQIVLHLLDQLLDGLLFTRAGTRFISCSF